MPEGRLYQLATNPMLTNFAVSVSQKAVLDRKIGNFLFPICEVPDVVVHYKKYTSQNRYRIPSTSRAPGAPATMIGADATDETLFLQPNALNFPIPNPTGKGIDGMNDTLLTYWIKTGQTTLAEVSALTQESQQINLAVNELTANKVNFDYSQNVDPIGDPNLGLDAIIEAVMLGALNGAPIKVLFGWRAFRKFRNNANVQGKFIVSGNAARGGNNAVGLRSPSIGDVGNLLINNPAVELAATVVDTSKPGQPPNISFLLADKVIVFASNDTPSLMDASFGKTFALMGGMFRPGAFITEDERDQVLKMDWISKPLITNTGAAVMIDTTTGLEQSAAEPIVLTPGVI